MALLAIFCGIVLPILFLYYCFKDIGSIVNKEEHEKKIEEMEREFEIKYGKSNKNNERRKQ